MLAHSALNRNLKFRKLSVVLRRELVDNYKIYNDNPPESDFTQSLPAAYQNPIITCIAKDMTWMTKSFSVCKGLSETGPN